MSGERTFLVGGHLLTAPPLEPALYVVATPIGNLGDITIRALETLAAADILACEDTRITRRLLERYDIRRRPVAYHEHNADVAGARLLEALAAGKSVALASDAGTPLVSDPGFRLVTAAREAGHRVIPLPGASAPLAALAASGMPSDDFRFIGFLPAKDAARRARLSELASLPSTLILFEAPVRLNPTLAAIAETMGGERPVTVARELTKRFETVRTGAVKDIGAEFAAGPVKGEIVILVAPAPSGETEWTPEKLDNLLADLLETMPVSKAAREAAETTGLPKNELYRRLLELKDGDGS
ncbi:16S rRNA (cytidine(1402)-2'-O)-methyltransferase [Oricola cellulosilytica]|uniref:Ribosomal RNA small subunit methyltransferase I n=1 Tax=Oricola cellulosilytica TaxID=1429082 RepID=A0A4R0PE44_9HYPH|nr:16S rRNA (cytidine(1402)-2'-O)-methyltransferase [Oricola cellulosilytica]TCD16065.1 16S rRNA (cytidine(1402)-2'-O)-methyltransferase [Oricola cellulosilytica]